MNKKYNITNEDIKSYVNYNEVFLKLEDEYEFKAEEIRGEYDSDKIDQIDYLLYGEKHPILNTIIWLLLLGVACLSFYLMTPPLYIIISSIVVISTIGYFVGMGWSELLEVKKVKNMLKEYID